MNSNINDEYHKIISDMDDNMSNPEDIEYAKEKMYELSMMFIDELQNLADKYDDRINAILQKQQKIDTKMKEVEKSIKEIQQDVYDIDETTENEVFDFEISCPYCNHVFETEVGEDKKEVQCPECENLIELDWDGLEEDGFCSGNCSHCHDFDDECYCGDDCECGEDCDCGDDCSCDKHDEEDDM